MDFVEPFGVVYGLFDPRTDALRYVGQTTQTLRARVERHMCEVGDRNRRLHVYRWIAQLREDWLKPVAKVLHVAYSREELDRLEVEAIAKAKADGCDLTNHALGGGGSSGPASPSLKEHLAKLHEGKRGVPRPEHVVARIAEAKRGQPSTFKGHTHTPEAKAANAAAHVGKHAGDAHPGWDDSIDTERDIIARLKTGMTATDVARVIGKTRTFVARRLAGVDLAAHGIVLKRGSRKGADQSHFKRRSGENHHAHRSEITTEEIERFKAEGLTPLAIAERLGCSETLVRGRLGLSTGRRKAPDLVGL